MSSKRVVLAEYFVADDKTLLFVIRKDFESPKLFEINKSRKEIRQFVIDHFGEKKDVKGNVVMTTGQNVSNMDKRAFQDFFNPFIAPLVSQYPKEGMMTNRDDIIWFVPHDMLHYVPLHALSIESEYLIQRNPVCYTPSASVMKYCHNKRKGRTEKALVLGDSLDDLIYARQEALTVARMFNTSPYLNGNATKCLVKEKLKKEGSELDIIHICCHGKFDSNFPLKSHIVLANEQNTDHKSGNSDYTDDEKWNLTAEEIFGMEMHADLVTLSSCESGVNDRKPGDELIGLTRSLIYAGTPSVIVSLWAVEDLSTSLIMQHFYEELQRANENGLRYTTKAEALRLAQIYAIDMTAKNLINYCDKNYLALGESNDTMISLPLQLAKANAQIVANDLKSAIATYDQILTKITVSSNKMKMNNRFVNAILVKLNSLKFIEKEVGLETQVNYDAKPFEHFYHWASFILIGDWR